MVKVLIVEDSIVARKVLEHILQSDSEIDVIGTATNGLEALEFLSKHNPDVITMDIIMPKMDGLEATRRIMETRPLPIVIVSASLERAEVDRSFKAIEAGAVAVLEKPRVSDLDVRGGDAEKLIQTVKLMSQVKLVKRWSRRKADEPIVKSPQPVAAEPIPSKDIKVVAIGASTGGPGILHRILGRLPADFPVPILLVQHISPGFSQGFVDWLNKSCAFDVSLATHGERAQPGHAYVAPDYVEMSVDSQLRIQLTSGESMNGNVPSVSCLFRSVAEAIGPNAVGVLLTGMGRDGASELKLMRDKGAITIAQNKETSIVYGMPGEAMKIGAAKHSLSPEQIAMMLKSLVNRR
jgi:two-component system chemotaxis response regulator CheB